MPPTTVALYLLIGVATGVLGGMLGIGGGILVIPVLMAAFGFSQAQANGTSLAMLLPPVGVFAVLAYWRAGNVNFPVAGFLAVGFAVGGYFGGRLANRVDQGTLKVAFAVLLLYVAGRTLFRAGGSTRAAVGTVAVMSVYAAARLLGRRWDAAPRDWAAVYRSKAGIRAVEHDYEI